MIVGYPGETEFQFNKTYNYIKNLNIYEKEDFLVYDEKIRNLKKQDNFLNNFLAFHYIKLSTQKL